MIYSFNSSHGIDAPGRHSSRYRRSGGISSSSESAFNFTFRPRTLVLWFERQGTTARDEDSTVYTARENDQIIATMTLSTKKPWAIDRAYFTSCKRPVYLTGMAVHPGWQRKGVGSRCIQEARRIALAWSGDALRLDAYDADAGAGGFYQKCNFQEVGRAIYRNTPLIYFEMLL